MVAKYSNLKSCFEINPFSLLVNWCSAWSGFRIFHLELFFCYLSVADGYDHSPAIPNGISCGKLVLLISFQKCQEFVFLYVPQLFCIDFFRF